MITIHQNVLMGFPFSSDSDQRRWESQPRPSTPPVGRCRRAVVHNGGATDRPVAHGTARVGALVNVTGGRGGRTRVDHPTAILVGLLSTKPAPMRLTRTGRQLTSVNHFRAAVCHWKLVFKGQVLAPRYFGRSQFRYRRSAPCAP